MLFVDFSPGRRSIGVVLERIRPFAGLFRRPPEFLMGEFLVIAILILFPWTATWLPQQMK